MTTLKLILRAIAALATAGVVIYKAFYGKDAKNRKTDKLWAELERLKNESETALVEGRIADHMSFEKHRVRTAKKLNRLLRRQ